MKIIPILVVAIFLSSCLSTNSDSYVKMIEQQQIQFEELHSQESAEINIEVEKYKGNNQLLTADLVQRFNSLSQSSGIHLDSIEIDGNVMIIKEKTGYIYRFTSIEFIKFYNALKGNALFMDTIKRSKVYYKQNGGYFDIELWQYFIPNSDRDKYLSVEPFSGAVPFLSLDVLNGRN